MLEGRTWSACASVFCDALNVYLECPLPRPPSIVRVLRSRCHLRPSRRVASGGLVDGDIPARRLAVSHKLTRAHSPLRRLRQKEALWP